MKCISNATCAGILYNGGASLPLVRGMSRRSRYLATHQSNLGFPSPGREPKVYSDRTDKRHNRNKTPANRLWDAVCRGGRPAESEHFGTPSRHFGAPEKCYRSATGVRRPRLGTDSGPLAEAAGAYPAGGPGAGTQSGRPLGAVAQSGAGASLRFGRTIKPSLVVT